MSNQNLIPFPTLDASARFVLTGATGFVGSHFLYLALKQGAEVQLIVRGESAEHARRRVLGKLHDVSASYGDFSDIAAWSQQLDVLVGDICQPQCAVSLPKASAFHRKPATFIHFAASLQFEERHRDNIFATNLGGITNALELAGALGVNRFVHVSTAYTAGTLEGSVPEAAHTDLDAFNNCYEESKYIAENKVLAWGRKTGIECHIARPSIVIGPFATRQSGGSSTGMYGFIREIYRLRRVFRQLESAPRIRGDENTPLNIVPVDRVTAQLWAILTDADSEARVHHLTSDWCPPVGDALRTLADRLDCAALELTELKETEMSPFETLLNARTDFYRSYLKFPKQFARRRAETDGSQGISLTELEEYVDSFLEELKARRDESVFQREIVHSFDGTPLSVFDTGPQEGPTIVLVNAFGMPWEFMKPLASRLKNAHRVITWETRGSPSLAGGFSADTCTLETHAKDLHSILENLSTGTVHLVGWCTGAPLALVFQQQYPETCDSLVSLNGAFPFGGRYPLSDFQQSIVDIMPRAASSEMAAEMYHKLIFSGAAKATNIAADDGEQVTGLLGAIDPELVHLASVPFRTSKALYRYAIQLTDFFATMKDWTPPVPEVPFLLIAGEQDRVAHPEGSVQLTRDLPHTTLVSMPKADHYSHFFDEEIAQTLTEFIQSQTLQQRVTA